MSTLIRFVKGMRAMTLLQAPTYNRTHSKAIDSLRGIAIALMIVDHIVIRFAGPIIIHDTITRAAMPIFFIISGHLIKRVNYRHILIGILGILLPLYVSFLDDPNVLFYYAIFSPVILLLKRYPEIGVGVLALCLTFYGNFHDLEFGNGYPPLIILSLMILGTMTPRIFFSFADKIRGFDRLGRFPLTIYVGHLLIIETIWRLTK